MALTKITGKGIGAVDEITSDTAGTSNFVAGVNAGDAITSGGNYNVCVGDEAGTSNTTGDSNVAVGFEALQANTTASNNTAVGYQAFYSGQTADNTTVMGYQALYSATAGGHVAIGSTALRENTTGIDNVAVGASALRFNTTGSSNVALGLQALYVNTTATDNTAVGTFAGHDITTGSDNTMVGKNAGAITTTAASNTMIGESAGANTNSDKNTFVGRNAGSNITSGAKNSILGRFNGNENNLDIRTSSNNVVLSDGDGNALYHIDSNAAHNPYRGSSSANNNLMSFKSNVGGTRNSNCNIQCDGDIFNTNNSYGQISDESLKENIVDANSQWDDIKALQVRNFSWIADELDAPNQIGVIAQEVETAGMNGLIKEQEDGTKGVKYSVLYVKAVKALQEAMTRIETLEAKVATLEGN